MPRKILIIEDEKVLNDVLKQKLSQEGFDITQSFDGLDGLKRLQKEHFDLILLDLVMPVKNGFEFLSDYVGKTRDPLPVMVLTNLSDFSSKMNTYKKGVISYLVKSDHTLEDIVAKVKTTLK